MMRTAAERQGQAHPVRATATFKEVTVSAITIYTRAWCPYCVKAKALLHSKGLEWRELDIGTDKALEQEMIERSGRHTVPEVFVDDELIGGYDDLARLNASGDLDARLGLPAPEHHDVYDIAVVGGGPAGLTAAMYAARKNLDTIVVATDIGGQLGTTGEVTNYPGTELILGPDLVKRLYAQAKGFGISDRIGERVAGLRRDGRRLVLDLESGREISALSVIVASGVQKRHLRVPGEKELAGRGVYYCATCDGPLMEGLHAVVVGGGNSGLQAALELAGIARQVTMLAMQGLTGDAVLADKVTAHPAITVRPHHTVTAIHGDGAVAAVTVHDVATGTDERLACDGVFVEIGYLPNTGFALDAVDTNAAGEILVDRRCRTGARGIFAAGDCTDIPDKQIVVSVGEGAKAALAAFEYLVTQA